MDKLKELLGELYDQVVAKLGTTKVLIDDGTYVKKDDANWIPKHRFDEVNAAKTAAEERVKKADEDLKTLKEKASGNDSLTQQITALQAQNKQAKEDFDKQQVATKKSTAVTIALLDAGVGDPAARALLSKSIDIDKIELDESGKPKGFDAIIKPIKENKAFAGMFGKTVIEGQEHKIADVPDGDFFTREQVQAMTQEQVNANLKKVNESMASWK